LQSAKTSATKETIQHTAPDFYFFCIACLELPTLSFLSLSHSFDQVAQVEALSKFTLPSKLFFEHIDSKLTSFEFKFHPFFVSICINSGDLKTSKWNHGSPSMKIHEILG
jgi:hypothetical protein